MTQCDHQGNNPGDYDHGNDEPNDNDAPNQLVLLSQGRRGVDGLEGLKADVLVLLLVVADRFGHVR